ncbi:hypothetical protein CY34DRAFT_45765, partial [Suillus luteus UH-Slu-Lm8-n1]
DGKRIVNGAEDGKIIIWYADTKDIIRCLSHSLEPRGLGCFHTIISSDEKRVACTSFDGTLKIWDAETWELVF